MNREYIQRSAERAKETLSKQPKVSAEEMYAQMSTNPDSPLYPKKNKKKQ